MTNFQPAPLDRIAIRRLVQTALEEDAAGLDLTTNALVPPEQQGHGILLSKSPGVICGLAFAEEAFALLDPQVQWHPLVTEGAWVERSTTIAQINGPLHAILRGERSALNFLQRLSGIATATHTAVERVAHTHTKILDTRKTTPGLRPAERYAVRVGGGVNHRDSLSAAILIKDNHIAAVRTRGGSLADAVRGALARAGPATAVEVEVTSLEELREALDAGARAVLLDNFSVEDLAEAVRFAHARSATTEASGGYTVENVAAAADQGVDAISLGSLTHSALPLDIALNLTPR